LNKGYFLMGEVTLYWVMQDLAREAGVPLRGKELRAFLCSVAARAKASDNNVPSIVDRALELAVSDAADDRPARFLALALLPLAARGDSSLMSPELRARVLKAMQDVFTDPSALLLNI